MSILEKILPHYVMNLNNKCTYIYNILIDPPNAKINTLTKTFTEIPKIFQEGKLK